MSKWLGNDNPAAFLIGLMLLFAAFGVIAFIYVLVKAAMWIW